MLPGKTYTPDDILRIARKRVWYVLLPTALIAAGTAIWARTLPDLYSANTTIVVSPQNLPESFVRNTVTFRLEDRLPAMTQEILSRPRLEEIIKKFDLYSKELKSGIMQDVVDKMGRDYIYPQPIRSDAFRITFVGNDPRTVQKVTEELAALFINANEDDRQKSADNATNFLGSELESAKRQLEDSERALAEYRQKNAGQLPTQLESNMQALASSRQELQNVMAGLDRERDNQARKERDITDAERQADDTPTVSLAAGATPAPDATPEQQLELLRSGLAAMLVTKNEGHPDVKKMKALIAEQEAKIAAMPKPPANDAQLAAEGSHLSAAERQRRKRLDDLQLELAQIKKNIANGEATATQLQQQIKVYLARNEAIPFRETEMTKLLRDYGQTQAFYNDLLKKQQDSKMAKNAETRQLGQRFKMIEPARIPERPFEPDRGRLRMMGLAAGLAVGLLLVGLLEYRDTSFKTDEDIARILTLPVLAVVPLMQSATEERRAFRNRLLIGAGFSMTVLGCLAIVVYTIVR